LVPQDELTFAYWRKETPNGRVLKPVSGVTSESAEWEEEVSHLPVVNETTELPPRTLIIGISVNGKSKAYPFTVLQRQAPIVDFVGGVPVILLVGDDKKSVRVFDRSFHSQTLNLFAKPETVPLRLVDSNTATEWDFAGTGVDGPLKGEKLKPIYNLKDYWFDWKNYHPNSQSYGLR
jgi:hypothetical protein